jgi:hypothetical protein
MFAYSLREKLGVIEIGPPKVRECVSATLGADAKKRNLKQTVIRLKELFEQW